MMSQFCVVAGKESECEGDQEGGLVFCCKFFAAIIDSAECVWTDEMMRIEVMKSMLM